MLTTKVVSNKKPPLLSDSESGGSTSHPIGTCGNVAQAGAVLAVAMKAVSNKVKQVAYPSCLSALLGITETAVFGVNLKFIRPFVCAMIGGGVGGFLAKSYWYVNYRYSRNIII